MTQCNIAGIPLEAASGSVLPKMRVSLRSKGYANGQGGLPLRTTRLHYSQSLSHCVRSWFEPASEYKAMLQAANLRPLSLRSFLQGRMNDN